MGREFEMKYAATPEKLEEIRRLWNCWTEFSMETTYFDTADRQLSGKNCTLRQRLENGSPVCTLKTPTGGLGRGEWDVQAPWSARSVAALFDAAGQPPIAFDSLVPVCGARFTRLARTEELPGCTVEIALDSGILLGGGRKIPLRELEVEVKSGSEAVAMAWADHFAQRFDLRPEHKSKFKRASDLARGVSYG